VRYLFEDFALDLDLRELHRGGDLVPLEPQAFDLLAYLIQNRARVVSKADLLAAIWSGRIVSESALTTRINAARCAIGDSGEQQRLIKTLLRKGVRFVGSVQEEQRPAGEGAAGVSTSAVAQPDRPAIAVLPFTNMSSEPEHEYFAIGITEDIITALSQYRWFSVVALGSVFPLRSRVIDVKQTVRELGVRYVVEGSVRMAASRMRITAQLIEGTTGCQLWAARFDRNYENIFGIQDEITESIVSAIEPEILMGEGQRAVRKPASSLDALDCCMRGMWHYNNISPEENRKALIWIRQAIERAPDLVRAQVYLARVLAGRCWFGFSEDVASDLSANRAAAERAVALDDRDPYAHYALAFYSMMTRQHQQALTSAQRAISISPNFALGFFALGITRIYMGQFKEGLDALLRALHLSPHDPMSFLFVNMAALAHYHLGHYEEAVECAERSVRGRRVYTLLRLLLASLGQLGRIEEAACLLTEMNRIRPADFQRYWTITNPYITPSHETHFVEGLRKAGAFDNHIKT
jgi:TolB-like protein